MSEDIDLDAMIAAIDKKIAKLEKLELDISQAITSLERMTAYVRSFDRDFEKMKEAIEDNWDSPEGAIDAIMEILL